MILRVAAPAKARPMNGSIASWPPLCRHASLGAGCSVKLTAEKPASSAATASLMIASCETNSGFGGQLQNPTSRAPDQGRPAISLADSKSSYAVITRKCDIRQISQP
jgi:hypothetical protein